MAFFTWSQDMSVGIDLIDSDHQALIRLINELHDGFEEDDNPTLSGDLFDRLVEYIELHFVREEAVMLACDYPDARSHQAQHWRFTHEIQYVRDRYIKGDDTQAANKLLIFLKNWLKRHILVEDMAYRPYTEGNPAAIDVADNYGPGLDEAHKS